MPRPLPDHLLPRKRILKGTLMTACAFAAMVLTMAPRPLR